MNRGWVPRKKINEETRREGQVGGWWMDGWMDGLWDGWMGCGMDG